MKGQQKEDHSKFEPTYRSKCDEKEFLNWTS